MADLASMREAGNAHFKGGCYEEALKCYIQALDLGSLKDSEKAILYKNKAACFLKLEKNEEALKEASLSLDISPNDPKALFRRCQAYQNLGQIEEAYKDAAQLIKVDPKNQAARTIFKKLDGVIQERIKKQNSTTNKVLQMFNLTFDSKLDKEKRLQGLNNLVVLAREEAGTSMIIQQGGLAKLKVVLTEKDTEVVQGAVRVLATLVKGNRCRAAAVVEEFDMHQLMRLMSASTEEMASSVALLLQNIITYYVGLDVHHAALKKHEEEKKKGERKPYPRLEIDESSKAFLTDIFSGLIKMLVSAKVTAYGRDSAMELITKNVTSKEGADWTKPFLDTEGLENLLTVAGVQKEFKTLPITEQSGMHASVALSQIYDDLINDKLREKFKEKTHEYFRELFADGIFESKVEAVAAISTLLQGPYEVGGMILSLEGVTQLMLSLAESESVQYQRVAVEAIVSSASKKDRCAGILKDAVPILKKLYQSGEDHIKVRALVGLCKLGSFGGTDASAQTMAEGSTKKLARICRKFLVNSSKDSDLGKWATEGLAYLTLDADIKEELVSDIPALKAIFAMSKESDRNMVYAAVTVLVNCSNSYDKQDVMPELLELAKFAKQHVPEEHEKDKPEFVSKRIHQLAEAGVINALVALSNTDSKNSRELLCRVYMSLATEESLRGLLIQQGAVKSLLNLTNNNTDNGAILAAHALAKISVTSDPHFAFPGQRVYEVVRPLISLLHADRSGLQNFEALMALTNLASMSESIRSRIVTEKGVPSIEHYMFESHEMLRRAATECMCNMVMSEKVQELYQGDNDRVKVLVLFSGEDDIALVKAATGALAVLSSDPNICRKITEVKSWLDILQVHLVSERPDLQHRACHIVRNIIYADFALARLVVESPMLEILMAVSKEKGEQLDLVRQTAQDALEKAVEHGLIKENQEGKAPDGFLEILREQLRKAAEEEEKKRKAEEEEEEKQKKVEEEEKRKLMKEWAEKKHLEKKEGVVEEEEETEEIIVDKREAERLEDSRCGGCKIEEITDEEAAKLEMNAKNSKEDVEEQKDEEIDEDELNKGDVWNDEKGLPSES